MKELENFDELQVESMCRNSLHMVDPKTQESIFVHRDIFNRIKKGYEGPVYVVEVQKDGYLTTKWIGIVKTL